MTNQAGNTPHWFEALIKGVSNLGMLLTNLCMVAMLVIIMLNVVLRYVIGAPLAGGDTAMIFLMITMVFTGLASIVLSGANIRMTAVVDRISRRKQNVLAAICAMINIVYFGVLVWAGYTKTANSYATKVYDIATDWPFWPVQAVMTLGLALAFIATFWVTYQKYKLTKADPDHKEEEVTDALDSSIINE
jgi:TRAP-type C4-dicarboxylate transport system permease small subunit